MSASFAFQERLTASSSRANQEALRVVVISDTHNMHEEFDNIPLGDVLIHCGDFTDKGTQAELESFNQWIGQQPHEHKLVVPGNHDIGPFKFLSLKNAPDVLSNCTFLDNDFVEIRGVKFYGSGWNRKRGASRKIPPDTHVLITHSPPGEILSGEIDTKMRHFGCDFLKAEVLQAARTGLKLHLFGHVHESHGMETQQGVVFVNASSVASGLGQEPHIERQPFIIDIP
mmetsp:Transcript_17356/g.21359  ORF Transcript_17356/g.21359 Transcript_17356/m.21359 type:complete len:228 (+) Transcript_17356:162-845(+)|eukprot:CAMPEP_0204830138 /NCGR_PEP_ID=MMETSP1346-20131115/8354_1 /ASSEMBLY_ACC=CAM_ASM_000771 /TAXON_ID=215587 /ORGANISM="Aplanochytrium stocchinoi, Strain GSBS06" /LENGTH=227 /DNA_ID=CAMNT_0051960279 /DNA_START=172 /DNA_END=855 /DNA_ORIENTATION=+